jgi:YVTN family beta-propeller protein
MRIHRSIVAAIVLPLAAGGMSWHRALRTHPAATRVTKVTGYLGRPFGVHVTANGSVLVTEQDVNIVRQVDALFQRVGTFEVGEGPGDVVATRDGRAAYVSGFQDGSITIVPLDGDTIDNIYRLPTENAYRLALSPNERKLYVTSTDGRLYVFNTVARALATSKLLGGSLQGLAVDHAGTRLYVSSTAGDVWRLDRGTLRSLRQTTLDCVAQDLALSSDDRALYVACEKGNVIVLDPRTLAQIAVIELPPAFGLAVTPDNAQLYVTSPGDGLVSVVDVATRKIVCKFSVKGTPRRIAFSPSGHRAYVTNEWNWLTIIE